MRKMVTQERPILEFPVVKVPMRAIQCMVSLPLCLSGYRKGATRFSLRARASMKQACSLSKCPLPR
jgi:hypothetical protein